ncbi:MAG: serine protease [Myxococcota bacterium]|nr:serine protease [Myxococcota bacterium]
MPYSQVVKIFATTQSPDYACPWQAQPPSSATGSGVIIGARQILTGAHVVANATFLQIQKISTPDKVIARVQAVCHDADLALLEIDDESFTEDIEPAELGGLPELGDTVMVIGFPVGGEEVSMTEGVVSRIEVQKYDHSRRWLLAATVDAAINEGNSGGPVFMDDQVVGIAFQTLRDAENVGEIVPTSIIRRFIEGHEQGRSPHIPGLGITTQTLENPLLRQELGLSDNESGLLVSQVEFGGSSYGHIEPGDILLRLGGHTLANNGTIQYQDLFRTRFDVALSDHFIDDDIEVEVLLNGQRENRSFPLKERRYLAPRSQYDIRPTYFIYGGLVFQPLSRNYLETWDDWWEKAPSEFLFLYRAGIRTEARQQIICLDQVLADELNVGYEGYDNATIKSVNGVEPRDMSHFAEILDAAEGVVHIRTSDEISIMLNTEEVREGAERILTRYQIPCDRSANLASS